MMENPTAGLSLDSPRVVSELFNPRYVTYEDAIASIQSGAAFSRAISPQVILLGNAVQMYVYLRGKLVGSLSNSKLSMMSGDVSLGRRVVKYLAGRITLEH